MNDELFSLAGKLVVVTGGMGQLGAEYCVAAAKRGADVVSLDLAATSQNNNEQFSRMVENKKITPFICDITSKKEVEQVLFLIQKAFSVSPNVLVNNAALDSPPNAPAEEVGPFESYPEESFDKVMEVNVKGTMLCCQVFGGRMAAERGGSIINVSSTYGILSPCQDIYDFRRVTGEEFYKPIAYSISKSAILNMTRYLSTYWAKKGVRVNTLTPGGIANNQPDEFLEAYCPRVPMGRMAEANEMVGAMVYLASDASSYVTGSNIVVDGGWSAW